MVFGHHRHLFSISFIYPISQFIPAHWYFSILVQVPLVTLCFLPIKNTAGLTTIKIKTAMDAILRNHRENLGITPGSVFI